MAGMIPGVGVAARRRTHYLRQEDTLNHRELSFRERLEPSTTTMDETALIARQRLEQKLGHFRSSSRLSKLQQNEGRGCDHTVRKQNTRLDSKILGKSWHFQLNKCKSKRKVCAVCLENFEAEQQVMDLSCSHKYHSNCLLPWLASHPHCPCCRSPVQS